MSKFVILLLTTSDEWNTQGVERVVVTNTDDLGVTLSWNEAATQFEQSIPSTARTEFIAGRRTFRGVANASAADGFLAEVFNFSGVDGDGAVANQSKDGGSPYVRSPGGDGHFRRSRTVGQDHRPVGLVGALPLSPAVPFGLNLCWSTIIEQTNVLDCVYDYAYLLTY